MPEVNPETYGKKPRSDGKPGHILITPTSLAYHEADGSDVRLDRGRIYDAKGNIEQSFLQDKMGVRFADTLSNTEDDLEYLKTLKKNSK